jgi:hypothetical protein
MDEIFGFMPPVENPPSKKPFLTLLKQARAFGLGVVVATQNPVDLDYKALSNTGTWLIGRLQTERDKTRLADGLASAAGGGIDATDLAKTIGSLEPRVFLMHNVHDSHPVLFQSRWALSYLAGPMTREQLRAITKIRGSSASPRADQPTLQKAPAQNPAASSTSASPPVLPPEVNQMFAPSTSAGPVTYRPAILGVARVHAMLPDGGTHTESVVLVAPLSADSPNPDWSTAPVTADAPPSTGQPAANASFAPLPQTIGKAGTIAKWGQALAEAVYRTRTVTIYEAKRLRLTSKPGETERDFRIRIADATRSTRDDRIDKLRDKYAAQMATIEDRIRRAEQSLSRERDQVNSQRMQTAVSVGATILSAFLGGGRKTATRASIGRATTAARGFERSAREQGDVNRAEESLDALRQRRDALAREVESAVAELTAKLEGGEETLTEKVIRPRKSDIEVVRVALLWLPVQTS